MAPACVINNEDRPQIHSVAQGSDSSGGNSPPSSPATLVPMRSTESKTRLERGSYLKKRSIDVITYREGCPTDKYSEATVRDEDPIIEEVDGGDGSRDDCSNGDSGAKSAADEYVHPLYVIQKTGTRSNQNQSTRVSKAYSFEEYWKIFDSVVEGCRCMSIAGCAAGAVNTPVTSFGNSIDEADVSALIATSSRAYQGSGHNNHNRSLAHTPVADSYNGCYYGQVTPQNHSQQSNNPSPNSSTANVGPIDSSSTSHTTYLSKGGATYPSTPPSSGATHQHPAPLRLLRDLECELSDDDDFRPAHRTSACFVLHEKDKVNDIFR
jgi:hypothetical protein